jgi:hypothetical protein
VAQNIFVPYFSYFLDDLITRLAATPVHDPEAAAAAAAASIADVKRRKRDRSTGAAAAATVPAADNLRTAGCAVCVAVRAGQC